MFEEIKNTFQDSKHLSRRLLKLKLFGAMYPFQARTSSRDTFIMVA